MGEGRCRNVIAPVAVLGSVKKRIEEQSVTLMWSRNYHIFVWCDAPKG
ncbi:hypothetical protein SCH4B_3935 [Ruegeria sp. TrichCH4B]|nr:hypothetical protein SCH4B_3935 [Ruegeria sp. TrichCH4B]